MEDQFPDWTLDIDHPFSELCLKINYDPSIRLQNWEEMPPDENASAFNQTKATMESCQLQSPLRESYFKYSWHNIVISYFWVWNSILLYCNVDLGLLSPQLQEQFWQRHHWSPHTSIQKARLFGHLGTCHSFDKYLYLLKMQWLYV